MYEHTIRQSIQIVAQIEEVFTFLVDPNKISLIMPGLIENCNIPSTPLQAGSYFDYTFKMYNTVLKGKWNVVALEFPTHYESVTDGDEQSRWIYNLSMESGSTIVDMVLEYKIPAAITAQVDPDIIKHINLGYVKLFLGNLKDSVEK